MAGHAQVRETLEAGLRSAAQCIPLDRLDGSFEEHEIEHVAACARCQTELALWQELRAPATTVEDSDVQWIVAELRRRRTAAAPSIARRPAVSRALLAVAASIVLAVGGLYLLRDPAPAVGDLSSGTQTYRAAVVRAVAPIGDLAEPPRLLEWAPIDGAVKYDVTLSEVDRTILWQGSSSGTTASLPPDIVARLVPGKTVNWQVTARSAAGTVLAVSGIQRFRVAVAR